MSTLSTLIPSASTDDAVGPVGRTLSKDRETRAAPLWQATQHGDDAERKRATDRLVELYLPLAHGVASRYRRRGLRDDDLEQVAALGLVKAVRGFDPDRGHAFPSYAVPTIRGELRRHFRDAGWMVRPPRRLQELRARLGRVEPVLHQELEREPTADELAERLETEPDEVRAAFATDGCFSPDSVDAPTHADEEGRALLDSLGAYDPGFEHAEARLALRNATRQLPERHRRILALRFFEDMTQEEIGQDLGVTQMQVSRLLRQILADLRTKLTGPQADPAR